MSFLGKIAQQNVFHFVGAIRNPEGVSYKAPAANKAIYVPGRLVSLVV
jgi:hypothetical protein